MSTEVKKDAQKQSDSLLSVMVATWVASEVSACFKQLVAGWQAIAFLRHYLSQLSGTVENGWAHIKSATLRAIGTCPNKSTLLRCAATVDLLFPDGYRKKIESDKLSKTFSYEGVKTLMKFVKLEETANDVVLTLHETVQGTKIDYTEVRQLVKDWLDKKLDGEGLSNKVNAIISGKPTVEPAPVLPTGTNGTTPPATAPQPGLTGASGASPPANGQATGTTPPAPASDGTAPPVVLPSQNSGTPLQPTTADAIADARKPAIAARNAMDAILTSLEKHDTAKELGKLLAAPGNMRDVVPSLMDGLISLLTERGQAKELVAMVADKVNRMRKPVDGAHNPAGKPPETSQDAKKGKKGKDVNKGQDSPPDATPDVVTAALEQDAAIAGKPAPELAEVA